MPRHSCGHSLAHRPPAEGEEPPEAGLGWRGLKGFKASGHRDKSVGFRVSGLGV